jgi:hypothetical protein
LLHLCVQRIAESQCERIKVAIGQSNLITNPPPGRDRDVVQEHVTDDANVFHCILDSNFSWQQERSSVYGTLYPPPNNQAKMIFDYEWLGDQAQLLVTKWILPVKQHRYIEYRFV